jgi:nucleotide-binding universal stress UspA family protein
MLAGLAGGGLTILRTVETARSGNVPSGRIQSTIDGTSAPADGRSDLARLIEWLGPEAGGAGPSVEVAVAFGVPGIEIGRMAELRGVDLVVIGRRPHATHHTHLLGETADALIRRCDRPVLSVPESVTVLGAILAALDGSARSRPVLEGARRLAGLAGGTVSAVTVEPVIADEEVPGVEVPRLGKSIEVRQLLHDGERASRRPDALSVRRGSPVQEILAEVKAAGSSVLVVGYRRGGPPRRVDPTGVARSLLYSAPCAVMTVPL